MDFRLLEYIVKTTKGSNITKASEELFISQSTLNQQFPELEQKLGTRLFYRPKTSWHLTEAGKIYVEDARDTLKIKHGTYTRIQNICDSKMDTLIIGLTHGRGIYMFASLHPELHPRCPDLDLRPVGMNVYKQQETIVQGSIDMSFLTLSRKQRISDRYESLISEEMVLALPASHPAAKPVSSPDRLLAVINLGLIKDAPFVLLSRESPLHEIVGDAFKGTGFESSLPSKTSNMVSILMMVQSTYYYGVVSYFYSREYPGGVVYFILPDHPCWDLAISYRRDIYLDNAARDFTELAKECWENQKG